MTPSSSAEVQVSHLVVCGEVRGNLFAAEKIENPSPWKGLRKPSRLRPWVMDEGVVFEGCLPDEGDQEARRRKTHSLPSRRNRKKMTRGANKNL